MDIQHSWDPYNEQANWERKKCGQLEGSEEQVAEEEEKLQKQEQEQAIIGVSICFIKTKS